MKGLINRILRKIVRRLYLIGELDELGYWQQKLVVPDYHNSVTYNDVRFFASAEVSNMQHDRTKISIGDGSQVAGMLMVVPFGGKINIGANCYVGDHSRIWSAQEVSIGNNVLISHNVNIMDTNAHELDANERAEVYRKSVITGFPKEKGSVETAAVTIHDNVWIGFNSIILKGVTIHEGAIVAAGSVITKDVTAFTIVAGNPAVEVKKLKG